MYFASRMQAGQMLAAKIVPKYKGSPCVVMALTDGGVIVGTQISQELDCLLMLLLGEEITLPRESDAFAGITSSGEFAYNSQLSSGEIDEYVTEYHGLIEQEKLSIMHELNRMTKKGSVISKELLKNKNVIIVSDGLPSAFELDLALSYLKTVRTKHLIFAIPIAGVKAIDRMHVTGDDIYCLSVVDDYINTDHYYDTRDVPSHEEIIAMLRKLIASSGNNQQEDSHESY